NVELGAIQEKQAAIETLGNQLTDSSNREVSVKNYLPENKVEERIIASINYLAGDANVSLADVSMGGVSTVVAPPVVVDPNVPASTPASLVKTTSAKISLVGNYEKIRIFLDGLAHMPIFNTVKSLDITKQIPEKKDGVAVDDGTLTAIIVVDFGYEDAAKLAAGSVTNFNPKLDDETINTLQQYISTKSQLSNDNGGSAKGKSNPFMAN
ncbi:MAG: hypothetical protein PHW24_05120, partial [Candidatus Moranbacteria bacterium]|nr:hypothetical protein [Candidatus Moranbacteria bacterium]